MLFKVSPGLEVRIIDRSGDWVQATRFRAYRRLDREKAPGPDLKKAGLYVHFPFCRRACFYCHFFKTRFRAERMEPYLAQVRREMGLRRDPGLAPDSVYIGGGSPSLLEAEQVAGILDAAAEHFRPAEGAEVTLEANPDDLAPARLRGWREAGVNRLSIGAQSFQESDLRFLKRTHGAAQGVRAVEMAGEAGFANVERRPDHRPAHPDPEKHGAQFQDRRDIEAGARLGLYPGGRATAGRRTTATPGSTSRRGGRCWTWVSGITRYPTSPGRASRRATT